MIKENPLKLKNHLEQTYGRPVDKIFFIGIGGSSMSGLAALAFDAGFAVEGSDMAESLYTKKLLANNVTITSVTTRKTSVPTPIWWSTPPRFTMTIPIWSARRSSAFPGWNGRIFWG